MTSTGSCHCGAVRFRVDYAITELTTCDCSLCAKRNAVMAKVPERARMRVRTFLLFTSGTRGARSITSADACGIYVFHRKRAAPDHLGVNVFCLENFDAAQLPIRATDGARMTIEDPAANPDWPGPRRSAQDAFLPNAVNPTRS